MLPENWLNSKLSSPIHKSPSPQPDAPGISSSADKIKIKKSLNEIDSSIKRRSVFEIKAKSMERSERY